MPLNNTEIKKSLKHLENWKYSKQEISKKFIFADFKLAFAFMAKIALIAEKMDHHPDWRNVYNTVEISLSTHSEGGVTSKDIKLAEEIEKMVAK